MRIDPAHWNLKSAGSHMVIDGCDVVELSRQYGTPLFVLREGVLRRRCRNVMAALANAYPASACFFSYKTNSVPGILKIIREENLGAEVISEFEFDLAVKLGVPRDSIIFDGVCKTPHLMEKLIKNNVRLINIDDESDIDILGELAERHGREVNVGVRINAASGWGKNPFGIDIRRVIPVFEKIKTHKFLRPAGLLMHSSPRARNSEDYLNKARVLIGLCEKLKKDLAVEIKYLDIGGGYGSAAVRRLGNAEKLLNLLRGINLKPPVTDDFVPFEKTVERVCGEILKLCGEKKVAPPVLHIEPGTAIVEDSQLLLTRVMNVKRVGGEDVIVTDSGGINMAYPLKQQYHELFAATRMNEACGSECSVVGRLCSPGDWMYRKKRLPRVAPGDVLAVMDTGAYFNSFSNNFSFPRPAVVSVCDGRAVLLREEETMDRMTGSDVF